MASPRPATSTAALRLRPGCAQAGGGPRAQVGLSLSLFVLLDRQIADARFRSLAVFFMGAQALLTLVVQGTTMPWLLQARGRGRGPAAPSLMIRSPSTLLQLQQKVGSDCYTYVRCEGGRESCCAAAWRRQSQHSCVCLFLS